MFNWKNMLVVVFKLFSANSTNNMVCSRPRLLNTFRIFLCICQLLFLLIQIFIILIIEKCRILNRKLSFSKKLENRSSKRCIKIYWWDVVLCYNYPTAKKASKLCLLSCGVYLKTMTLLGVLVSWTTSTTTYHMGCLNSRLETWNSKVGCFCLFIPDLVLCHCHFIDLSNGDRSALNTWTAI
jgi:hypothetical protein